MFIDGSEVRHYDIETEAFDLSIVKTVMLSGGLGLLSPMINYIITSLTEDERPIAAALLEKQWATVRSLSFEVSMSKCLTNQMNAQG